MSESNEASPKKTGLKEKCALTTLSLNLLLTILKFVLYGFSGSLAILAEAWHSFSDIGTSFMVYMAMRHERKNNGAPDRETDTCERKINFEQWVSIGIGLFLLVVAIMLFWKFFFFRPVLVKYPLQAGLIFIGFSIGSYLVYRFETGVGRSENSVGLISDGMHARTDMIASLLTGFSLILYHMGLDMDKYVAGIIALFVFSFAIETIVNVSLSITHREKEALFRYKSVNIVAKLFSPTTLNKAGEFLDKRLHIHFFGTSFAKRAPVLLLNLLYIVLLVWWLSTCTFQVGPSEEAVVERFGKPLQTESPLGPGLHFKAPWPIDEAVKVETRTIRTLEIGNVQMENTFALIWMKPHAVEQNNYISGDNNFFLPYLVLHYKIKNLNDFLYKNMDSEEFLESVAQQFTVKVFATKTFYDIAIDYRKTMVEEMLAGLQQILDEHENGIELVNIAVKDIHPPIAVAGAFEYVIASYQEKERVINEAVGYRNKNIPETRGSAIRMRKEAEGYFLEHPLRSKGEAEYFLSRIPEDPRIREITKKRLYLDAMREALTGRSKVIVDPRTGCPEIWLNAKEILGSQAFDFEKGQF